MLSRSLGPCARWAFLALAAALCGGAAKPGPLVRYQLEPEPSAARPHLRVSLSLQGDADGVTELAIPKAWGGEQELYKQISDLAVDGGSLEPADSARPERRAVRHRPGAALTVSYRVDSAYESAPEASNGNPYRAQIGRDYLFLIGSVFLIEPDLDGPGRPAAEFRWRDLPAGWAVVSSFGDGPVQRVAPERYRRLGSSAFMAGRFRTETRRLPDGSALRVAVRGDDWTFTDDALADTVARVLKETRAFWRDERADDYLVTLLRLTPVANQRSRGGTGLTDCFALFADPETELNSFVETIAHEYQHEWTPQRMGGLGEPRQGMYWFSEGFTDFYTRAILRRSGLWSTEDFVRGWNLALAEYAALPVRAAPNTVVVERFWTDEGAQRLPYLRGALLAALWDGKLRSATGGARSLDDVMRNLLARPDGSRLDIAAVASAVDAVAPVGAAADAERHIVRGDPVVLPPDLFGGCFRVETVERPEFHRGFDVEATGKAGVVVGVRPDSPAYAAGLRDGMTILRRELGEANDPDVEIGYRVADGSSERLIRYFPRGTATLSVQRLVRTTGPELTSCG